LSGFSSLENVEEHDRSVLLENGLFDNPRLGNEAEEVLADDLLALARETWQRARIDAATGTELLTPLDRVDDALRDLGREGFAFMKGISCAQVDDLFDAGSWIDVSDPFQNSGAKGGPVSRSTFTANG
jgi:hypothetical protein